VTALRYTKWLIDNFCPKEIFDDIADRPDPSTARLRNSESGDELAQSQPSRDEILMKLKVTMARIVAFDAFRSAIPHLDIILTPNGFGIVNNSNIAPASKERVERLINSLLDNRDNEIESLLSLLPKETGWTSSDQGRFFASTMFPHIDVTTRLPKVSCGRWEQYLTVRETLQVMEDFFARQYLSKPLLQVFRDEVQVLNGSNTGGIKTSLCDDDFSSVVVYGCVRQVGVENNGVVGCPGLDGASELSCVGENGPSLVPGW